MKCRQCGRDSRTDAKFCSNCGAPLGDPMGDTTTVLTAITDDYIGELSEPELDAVRNLSAGDALLIIRGGGSEGSRFLIDTDVTSIGRHPASDIFLDDITVSRHHAKFVRTGTDLRVEDQGSLNGTYVNRKIVAEPVALHQGDEIQIGKFRATISLSEPGGN
ncbi:FHA domain-containing protein [Tessaracoccus antarcticus]|uniref:FHA domain-containing protein n=1 Tax=Tessaracoccus antarcticus TaxID=2479848 RepID=A0A3M0G6H4_9ACTN|nr:FHA domain-containing protein [Tessaracoccus antarcticus]RMB60108.1 FHA domain-containing protein [Tessaracoccus antarcticus]